MLFDLRQSYGGKRGGEGGGSLPNQYRKGLKVISMCSIEMLNSQTGNLRCEILKFF